MADLTAGAAEIEGEVYVRVRGRLRSVFCDGGHWFAQVRFSLDAHELGFRCEIFRLSDVMIVPEDFQHVPIAPPIAATSP